MIADLQNPKAYPEKTNSVDLVQTHISWVFICDDFVYKLKKPMDFGFLDFSTLEKRNYYCHQEIVLNSRLAKDVYLGVYDVVFEKDRYKISTDDDNDNDTQEPVEYAVKMRILPDEVLLKNKFNAGTLTMKDIGEVAKIIAKFHSTAARSTKIDRFGSLATVKFNTDENFHQTKKYIDRSIMQVQFDALKRWTDDFYKRHAEVFQNRIALGKVRDCHGDLHMEHICLTWPITIFDCIEFNDRFRYSDTASDLAFLLMDLEFHYGGKFAEKLYKTYKRYSGEADADFDLIVNYYKVYRAYVRGKVNSFQLNDPNISDVNKFDAQNIAQRYFELAHSYIK